MGYRETEPQGVVDVSSGRLLVIFAAAFVIGMTIIGYGLGLLAKEVFGLWTW